MGQSGGVQMNTEPRLDLIWIISQSDVRHYGIVNGVISLDQSST